MNEAQGLARAPGGRFSQAAAWATRLREAQELSAEELRAWQQFIGSAGNREAFAAVQRIANLTPEISLPAIPDAAELAGDGYDGSVSVREWRAAREVKGQVDRKASNSARRKGWFFGIAAAATCVLLTAIVWVVTERWHSASHQLFQTGAAEHREILLGDGSKVTLGAKTAIDVHYTADQRHIRLRHGEVLFTVARNPERPFIVSVGAGSVTAVGTEFNVWHDLGRTKVTVTDGVVNVKPIDAAGTRSASQATAPKATRLQKGQEISYVRGGPVGPVTTVDIASATAWRDGQLVYRSTPLKYVISDVNRYFPQQLVIEDEAVGELQFSGTVPQSLPADDFMHALEKIFPVQAVRVDGNQIALRLRREPVKIRLLEAL